MWATWYATTVWMTIWDGAMIFDTTTRTNTVQGSCNVMRSACQGTVTSSCRSVMWPIDDVIHVLLSTWSFYRLNKNKVAKHTIYRRTRGKLNISQKTLLLPRLMNNSRDCQDMSHTWQDPRRELCQDHIYTVQCFCYRSLRVSSLVHSCTLDNLVLDRSSLPGIERK